MHIHDLYDNKIHVTDLPAAIRQAADFVAFQIEDPQYDAHNRHLQQYWQDMLLKLLALPGTAGNNDNGNGQP